MNETLIIWGGEFGRTPMNEERNGSKFLGRDHHPHAFTIWMAGGGVKGGTTYGATDELGYHAAENRVHVHDLQATILHCLGLDHTKLTYQFQGRDYRLTDVFGNVVQGISGLVGPSSSNRNREWLKPTESSGNEYERSTGPRSRPQRPQRAFWGMYAGEHTAGHRVHDRAAVRRLGRDRVRSDRRTFAGQSAGRSDLAVSDRRNRRPPAADALLQARKNLPAGGWRRSTTCSMACCSAFWPARWSPSRPRPSACRSATRSACRRSPTHGRPAWSGARRASRSARR